VSVEIIAASPARDLGTGAGYRSVWQAACGALRQRDGVYFAQGGRVMPS
jgi:hypothetical protein